MSRNTASIQTFFLSLSSLNIPHCGNRRFKCKMLHELFTVEDSEFNTFAIYFRGNKFFFKLKLYSLSRNLGQTPYDERIMH